MKSCKDCRHCVPDFSVYPDHWDLATCHNPACTKVEVAYHLGGESEFLRPFCSNARRPSKGKRKGGKCSPEATFFYPRDERPPKARLWTRLRWKCWDQFKVRGLL